MKILPETSANDSKSNFRIWTKFGDFGLRIFLNVFLINVSVSTLLFSKFSLGSISLVQITSVPNEIQYEISFSKLFLAESHLIIPALNEIEIQRKIPSFSVFQNIFIFVFFSSWTFKNILGSKSLILSRSKNVQRGSFHFESGELSSC